MTVIILYLDGDVRRGYKYDVAGDSENVYYWIAMMRTF